METRQGILATCAIGWLLFGTAVFSGESLAEATGYRHKITANGDGTWNIVVRGTPTDHPVRIEGLAQLLAARHVRQKGFSHFRGLGMKKSIECKVSKEFGTVTQGFAVVTLQFSAAKKAGNGNVSAREFDNRHGAKLLAEPETAVKRKVEGRTLSECVARQKTLDGLY